MTVSKIEDLINNHGDKPWFAFEFFPPRTEQGVTNLYKKMEALTDRKPLYIDFTWGAGGTTSDLTLDLAVTSQQKFGTSSNMHLTCTNMPREKLDNALKKSKEQGIKNILALRGDPPAGQENFEKVETGFGCALDLVKYIRKEYGNEFSITVAGYPEGHPDRIKKVIANQSLTPAELGRCVEMEDGTYVCSDSDFQIELDYLKEKQDAGANMVVTQLFYDVDVFLTFVKQCRAHGITIPIIPGIMCVVNYNGFEKFLRLCKTRLPEDMKIAMEKTKDDQAAMEKYVIEWVTKTSKTLLDNGHNGLHFYVLNQSKIVLPVLDALNL